MSRFLSRTVSYALQATLQLAATSSKDPVPCSRLAAQGHMPERFLLQILRNLVTHGILQSTRGVDGGYMLERKPTEITLLEIIEAVDGPLVVAATIGEAFPRESKQACTRRSTSWPSKSAVISTRLNWPICCSRPAGWLVPINLFNSEPTLTVSP